jgi:hypothetical protein
MAALEFLYAATAKECFQEAAAAMREMHLVEGGLKLKALDSIKNRTAAHRGAFTMHLWIVINQFISSSTFFLLVRLKSDSCC